MHIIYSTTASRTTTAPVAPTAGAATKGLIFYNFYMHLLVYCERQHVCTHCHDNRHYKLYKMVRYELRIGAVCRSTAHKSVFNFNGILRQ